MNEGVVNFRKHLFIANCFWTSKFSHFLKCSIELIDPGILAPNKSIFEVLGFPRDQYTRPWHVRNIIGAQQIELQSCDAAQNNLVTRMYSSRIRSVRLLTVSRSIPCILGEGGLPNPLDADPPRRTPWSYDLWCTLGSHPSCGQNDRRVWKYYLAPNFVCGLKKTRKKTN